MEAKTKYNIGDKVYYLSNNAIECEYIDFITIEVNINNIVRVVYRIKKSDNSYKWRTENKLFSTKEELLKTL